MNPSNWDVPSWSVDRVRWGERLASAPSAALPRAQLLHAAGQSRSSPTRLCALPCAPVIQHPRLASAPHPGANDMAEIGMIKTDGSRMNSRDAFAFGMFSVRAKVDPTVGAVTAFYVGGCWRGGCAHMLLLVWLWPAAGVLRGGLRPGAAAAAQAAGLAIGAAVAPSASAAGASAPARRRRRGLLAGSPSPRRHPGSAAGPPPAAARLGPSGRAPDPATARPRPTPPVVPPAPLPPCPRSSPRTCRTCARTCTRSTSSSSTATRRLCPAACGPTCLWRARPAGRRSSRPRTSRPPPASRASRHTPTSTPTPWTGSRATCAGSWVSGARGSALGWAR
jgi:hypothetical protein